MTNNIPTYITLKVAVSATSYYIARNTHARARESTSHDCHICVTRFKHPATPAGCALKIHRIIK